MITDVTEDNESRKSLVLDRVDSVTNNTEDVKTRQDWLRQIDLHVHASLLSPQYTQLHSLLNSADFYA